MVRNIVIVILLLLVILAYSQQARTTVNGVVQDPRVATASAQMRDVYATATSK